MAADNLPPEVIRLLSLQPKVSWWVGRESAVARGEAALAPFEDVVCLFAPQGGPMVKALDTDTFMRLVTRSADGAYQLRVEGRAVVGLPLGRHVRRPELTPWAPENASPGHTVVVSLTPEFVELTRGDAESRERFVGPTPAGRDRPERLRSWLRAGLSGLAIPFAVIDTLGIWLWLGLQGPDYPARPVALVLALAGGLLPLIGARLVVQTLGFRRWQAGEVEATEAPVLVDGLLSHDEVWFTGLVLGGVGLLLLLVIGLVWGGALLGVAFGLSGVWVVAPVWVLHLSVSQPKR